MTSSILNWHVEEVWGTRDPECDEAPERLRMSLAEQTTQNLGELSNINSEVTAYRGKLIIKTRCTTFTSFTSHSFSIRRKKRKAAERILLPCTAGGKAAFYPEGCWCERGLHNVLLHSS
ncbi:hypothetical protein Anapl_11544 [Anas platyrhynchos]|uniref:Uncharacterized protein n=1 Tax=Anas platyrhynchos TaxID=8839 RepID=R0LFC5_ANAPL|nr:hypothetical protein Anapl_11544 [Anas platyrhynchos]